MQERWTVDYVLLRSSSDLEVFFHIFGFSTGSTVYGNKDAVLRVVPIFLFGAPIYHAGLV